MSDIQPILFRGKEYLAKKLLLKGTHRCLNLEETYQKVQRYEKKIGLTRNANITGLDRLGIPVTLAIRPNSLTISTSSGKGLSLQAALVSGMMEALEIYHAETTCLPSLFLPYEQLTYDYSCIPIENLPLRKASLFHPKWPERWVLGWDLLKQEEVAVPAAAVLMDYQTQLKERTDLGSFISCTNGLASGNHFLEALASSLYELIERDAVSCHEVARREKNFQSPKVCLETIPFPVVRDLIAGFERVEVSTFLYDCTVDTNVPVFKAVLFDKQYPHLGFIAGYGAHLDPEVAMLRALTEAAQGHTGLISGSREDLFTSKLSVIKQGDLDGDLKKCMEQAGTVDASTFCNLATTTFEEDVHLLLTYLERAGLKQVIVFDLTQKEFFDVAIVRTLVPGLEGYYGELYRPKLRAKQFCHRQKIINERSPLPFIFHQPAGRG